MVISRPIQYTAFPSQTQARFFQTGTTIRPIVPPSYSEQSRPDRPLGLSPGETTQETIDARSQKIVNQYPQAPFQKYTIMNGYWYGVQNVGGETLYTKLNEAPPGSYPNPGMAYREPYTGPASRIQAGERPTPPAPGSPKSEWRAYSEALASWERAKFLQESENITSGWSWWQIQQAWEGIRLPNLEMRAEEIFRSSLPQIPSAKYQSLVSQYQQQKQNIVSSSGTITPTGAGYINITTGESFVLPTQKAPTSSIPTITLPSELPSPITRGLIGQIAYEKLGMDYLIGGGPLPATTNQPFKIQLPTIPVETATKIRETMLSIPVVGNLYSAGEYIGADIILSQKISEYEKTFSKFQSQGLISGDVFLGTEEQYKQLDTQFKEIQRIQSLQTQAAERALGVSFQELKTRPATTGWVYEGGRAVTDWIGTNIIKPGEEAIGKLSPVVPVVLGGMTLTGIPATVLPQTIRFTTGAAKGIASTPEFVGMAVVGAEGLARNPQAIPGAIVLGGYIQAKGAYEGLSTRPVEFAGELVGSAIGLHAAGKAISLSTGIKTTTGKFAEEGLPTAKYYGIRWENPLISWGRELRLVSDIEGISRVRNIGGITIYEGTGLLGSKLSSGAPMHLEPYIMRVGKVPDIDAYISVPIIQRVFTPKTRMEFTTALRELELTSRFKPTTIKNPLEWKQEARPFFEYLKEKFPKAEIGGSFSQWVQSKYSRYPVDVDITVPKEQLGYAKRVIPKVAERYNVKIDIHEIPESVGNYGLPREKPIEVEGLTFWAISEQASRKMSSIMMLKKTGGEWSFGGKWYREGKDIADTNGSIRNELYRLETSPLKFLYKERIEALKKTESMLKPKITGEAATRLSWYKWDKTPSPYIKLPFTQKYVIPETYGPSWFEINIPWYKGVPGHWGMIYEKPEIIKKENNLLSQKTTREQYFSLEPSFKKHGDIYPSISPIKIGTNYLYPLTTKKTGQNQGNILSSYLSVPTYRYTKQQGVYPVVEYPYPSNYSLTLVYPSNLVYPSSIGYPSAKYPNYIKYPGYQEYPKSKQYTSSLKYQIPGKYPIQTKYPINNYPTPKGYPTSLIYPGLKQPIYKEYPTAKISGVSQYQQITKTSSQKYSSLIKPSMRPIKQSITVTFTLPRPKLLIIKETPKKKKGIRKHFDVLGSKWNIRSPVPRPGISPLTGPQLKNELKIYNLMKSRKRETYEIHGPFEKIEVLTK